MAELRRLLGVLNDDGEATSLAPQPGLSQLGALVDRVREAGLPAELTIDGTPRSLPASLDTTIYRIVQEALTNALRYARRAATLVRVTLTRPSCGWRSSTTGRPRRATRARAPGAGWSGCERAGGRRRLGGPRSWRAPRLGGGYAVRAWLPTSAVPAPPASGTAPSTGRRRRARPVLIADDQALVRAGFRMILEAQPDINVVGEAADGATAVARGAGDFDPMSS